MKAVVFLILTAFYHLAFPGGFQINIQSIKAMGMGHTSAALAIEPATLFFNPGLSPLCPGVSAGSAAIIGRISYREMMPGTYTAHSQTIPGFPFCFHASEIKDLGGDWKFSLGISVTTPFGSRVQYDDGWKGQFMLREMDLRIVHVQPTIAISFGEKAGIGIGYVESRGRIRLRKALPVQNLDGTFGEVRMDGQGRGPGFNAGGFIKISEKFRLGLSHRSSVRFSVPDGKVNFFVPESLADSFGFNYFKSVIRLPSTTTIGGEWKFSKSVLFALDVNYVGWRSYDTLRIDFLINTSAVTDQASPRRYGNTFIFRLGSQIQVTDRLIVRGGGYFDITPVRDGYLTAESPDASKIGFSTGGTFAVNHKLELDAAFLWVEGIRRTGSNDELNFAGTFKSRAFVPAIGIHILFE